MTRRGQYQRTQCVCLTERQAIALETLARAAVCHPNELVRDWIEIHFELWERLDATQGSSRKDRV
jgi:hypothetical protein